MPYLTNDVLLRRRQQGQALLAALPRDPTQPAKLAVGGTFNLDLLPPLLAERLEQVHALGPLYAVPFGQLQQSLIDPASGLYQASPQQVVLVVAIEDLLAPLFARPGQFSAEAAEAFVAGLLAEWEQAIQLLLSRLPAAVCCVVPIGAAHPPCASVLDPRSAARGDTAVRQMTAGLLALGKLSPRVIVVDWETTVRRWGWEQLHDDRLWYLGRMRLNPQGTAALAEAIVVHLTAYSGQARKVLVLDLDNTLWGGVVGEVGLEGIELGDEGLGLAYQDFQRELVKYRDVGVLLALCSKNNSEDAWEVFDKHPGMVLRRDDLAASRINWTDKATNLREIASELNLGLDSFVFLDDNPVERAWIRDAVAEVLVPELPDDPVARPAFLRQATFCSRIDVTAADRQRAEAYRVEALRNQSQASAASLDDFVASLEQVLTIAPLEAGTMARAAQMCGRTNQFNLTTRRYTAAELAAMSADPNCLAVTLAARDRFGDHGITGLAIVKFRGSVAELDTLLLSCRILGRYLEQAFLAHLCQEAQQRGARLQGVYLPTAKNRQVADFLKRMGAEPAADGSFAFTAEGAPRVPPQVTMQAL